MDIIITGEAGAGKTRAAQLILSKWRPAYGRRLSFSDVLEIDGVYDNPANVTETLRESRCRAVVFDGCISSPRDLKMFVEAVDAYRKQITADVLAIYVTQPGMVQLTDEPPLRIDPISTEPHSLKMLSDLWDTVYAKADAGARELMAEKLDSVGNSRTPHEPARTCWGLHHLDVAGKIMMHEFLLDLLRKYE